MNKSIPLNCSKFVFVLAIAAYVSGFVAVAEQPTQQHTLLTHNTQEQSVAFVASMEELSRSTNINPEFLRDAHHNMAGYVKAARSHLIESKEITGKLDLVEVSIYSQGESSTPRGPRERGIPNYWYVYVQFRMTGSGVYMSGPELNVMFLPDQTVVRKVFLKGSEILKKRDAGATIR